jgi:hypothetical protein
MMSRSSSRQALRHWSAIVAVAALRTRAYLCAPCFLSSLCPSIFLSVPSVRPSVRRPAAAAATLSPFALRVRCTEISLYLSATVGEEASPCHRLPFISLYRIRNAIAAALLFSFMAAPTHTTVPAQAARIDRGWLCLSVMQYNCKPVQFASMHPAVSRKGKEKKSHLF